MGIISRLFEKQPEVFVATEPDGRIVRIDHNLEVIERLLADNPHLHLRRANLKYITDPKKRRVIYK